MDGWMDGCIYIDGCMGDGWVDGWMDRWVVDEWMVFLCLLKIFRKLLLIIQV